MRRKRVALGIVGGAATLLAALAVVRPDVVLGVDLLARPVRTVSSMRTRDLLLGGSALVGLYALWAARSPSDERVFEAGDADERFERITDRPPERVTADERTLSARELDETIEVGVEGDEVALDRVRDRLRSLAVARLDRTRSDGGRPADSEPPGATIAAGDWTDDRTAAAFLSEGEPSHSLFSRLRLWLDPAAERERRVRRTVAAIEALEGDR